MARGEGEEVPGARGDLGSYCSEQRRMRGADDTRSRCEARETPEALACVRAPGGARETVLASAWPHNDEGLDGEVLGEAPNDAPASARRRIGGRIRRYVCESARMFADPDDNTITSSGAGTVHVPPVRLSRSTAPRGITTTHARA